MERVFDSPLGQRSRSITMMLDDISDESFSCLVHY